MSGEAGAPQGRARPLSGGLWTLFSWLRRDEHSSRESISSVGSDRSAASFAFLGPGAYAGAAPLVLPPPAPPTDSYKKRVRDRNLRRHHDRDITIHRKYGLYGYDAFSLPNSRRVNNELQVERSERDRRANSESLVRRTHVPGKRRAPLPPTAVSSLGRRRARKRPAPQPPSDPIQKPSPSVDTNCELKVSLPMNSERTEDKSLNRNNEVNLGGKFEKYSKKDANPKDSSSPKVRHEKSFLKQIFENKKRHSAIESSSLKLLPNISELDKQAAEIIEKYKLKEINQNDRVDNDGSPGPSHQQTESWICTRCLRKYNATVVTCLYCLPLPKTFLIDSAKSDNGTQTSENKISNLGGKGDIKDKEKLKEMLKEIKNSLPKKQTPEPMKINEIKPKEDRIKNFEAPTLRIGSSSVEKTNSQNPTCNKTVQESSVSKILAKDDTKHLATINNVVISQPVVLKHTQDNIVKLDDNKATENIKLKHVKKSELPKNASVIQNEKAEVSGEVSEVNSKLNTPLKISSLLNPIYVPKLEGLKKDETALPSTSAISTPSTSKTNVTNNIKIIQINNNKHMDKVDETKQKSSTKSPEKTIVTTGTKLINREPINSILKQVDQHSRRRDLINQLERSIAVGDERAAAEAAIKLAQLKLSCSVLSFSSQIISQPSTSRVTVNNNEIQNAPTTTNTKSESTEIKNNVITENKTKEVKKTTENIKPPQASTSSEIKIVKNNPVNQEVIQPVASTSTTATQNDNDVGILVWIEDKEATRGPVQLHIRRNAKMGELREQTEKSLGLASRMQRWIIGRNLCSDDNTPLITLAGPDMSAPFYLCLVETESKKDASETTKVTPNEETGNVYNELVKLEQMALISNTETFECAVCMEDCPPGNGVILRECVHSFCKECLTDAIRHCEEPAVACPATACRGVLQEREIRGLVSPDDYEKWLARGLAVAESGTRNAFHCRTRDCRGWALCDPGVKQFPCPVCKHVNCIACQAIHEGQTCKQHQSNIQKSVANNVDGSQTDDSTRAFLETLISRGEALECPECSAIITKKWGCDWIKCSACKTEICWVTRGRRWGPGGRGDTSAGCRCGVDGKKCHPTCGYCH